VAIGRAPNGDRMELDAAGIDVDDAGRIVVDAHQRTTAEGVWALGDVSTPVPLKHVANREADVVRHNLRHPDDLVSAGHDLVPSAIFTHPQIAAVGATEQDLRDRGVDYRVGLVRYGDVAYGWAMEDTTGIAKLIVDDDSGLLVGAHIMGHQASSLIQPLIQAMAFDLPAQDMARGQYWIHPALPEVVENALLALCGEPPWPPSKRH
jgi:mycothione reductase